jgi:hypothetical protein
MKKLISRSILTWILFMPIAILNGIIRETTYKNLVGDFAAHQISTIPAIIAFLILAYFMLRKSISIATTPQLFLIGFSWFIVTIIFEFSFGRFVDGNTWQSLINDYNLFQGRLWVLFLINEIFTPYFIRIITRLKS